MEIDNNGYVIINEKANFSPNLLGMCFFYNNNKNFFKDEGLCTHIEAELLSAKIGQKLGLNVLSVKPAVYKHGDKNVFGITSENYVMDDIRISMDDLVDKDSDDYDFWKFEFLQYETVIDCVDKYIKNQNQNSEQQIKLGKNFYTDLQNIIFFDFLTMQEDRAFRNIDFILRKKQSNWVLDVAPIFDNSMGFCLSEFQNDPTGKNQKSQPEYIEKNFNTYAEKTKTKFSFEKPRIHDDVKQSIEKRITTNKNFQTLAKKALNIDIMECIEEVQNENKNFKMDSTKLYLIYKSWNYVKNIIRKDFMPLCEDFQQ